MYMSTSIFSKVNSTLLIVRISNPFHCGWAQGGGSASSTERSPKTSLQGAIINGLIGSSGVRVYVNVCLATASDGSSTDFDTDGVYGGP